MLTFLSLLSGWESLLASFNANAVLFQFGCSWIHSEKYVTGRLESVPMRLFYLGRDGMCTGCCVLCEYLKEVGI